MSTKSEDHGEYEVVKTEDEWQQALSSEEYRVLREKGTEPAGSGEYDKFYPQVGEGYFSCKACGNPLYSAAAKFNSGCGWPAFDKCFENSVKIESLCKFNLSLMFIFVCCFLLTYA